MQTVGVDYLTATKPFTDEEGFYRINREVRERAINEGCKESYWHFYGYRGVLITAGADGHYAFGDHDRNGTIVQMSGVFATLYWHKIAMVAKKVTRVDLRADHVLETPDDDLAAEYYRWLLENGNGKVRTFRIIMNANKGDTLYVGSRTSQSFGRVYDKGGEEGGSLGKKWRYEVEYKHPLADPLARALAEIENDGRNSDNLAKTISATVWNWFSEREVPPLFTARQAALDVSVSLEGDRMEKVEWLRRQVSPTVRRLVLAGRAKDVIDALGLSGVLCDPGIDEPPQALPESKQLEFGTLL